MNHLAARVRAFILILLALRAACWGITVPPQQGGEPGGDAGDERPEPTPIVAPSPIVPPTPVPSPEPDFDPCRAAVEGGLVGQNTLGFVVCWAGRLVPCVDPAKLTLPSDGRPNEGHRRANGIIAGCVIAHEESHIADVATGLQRCSPPNPVTGVGRLGGIWGAGLEQSECTAYGVEASCLRSSMNLCDAVPPCADPGTGPQTFDNQLCIHAEITCREALAKRVALAEEMRAYWCGQLR